MFDNNKLSLMNKLFSFSFQGQISGFKRKVTGQNVMKL